MLFLHRVLVWCFMFWSAVLSHLTAPAFLHSDKESQRDDSEFLSSCPKVQTLPTVNHNNPFCGDGKARKLTISRSGYLCPSDCENLIRKMLVVDPAKRISMAQIKQHRWMLADPTAAHQTLSHSLTEYNSNLGDYSEPVLGIMNTLGIDRQRTIEVTEQKVMLTLSWGGRAVSRWGGLSHVNQTHHEFPRNVLLSNYGN